MSQHEEISKSIKDNGLFCRQKSILNSFIQKSESSEEVYENEDALIKAFPLDKYHFFAPAQVHNFLEDLKKAEEDEIAKGKKDYSKLQKKIVINKAGQKKIVYVKEIEDKKD